MKKTTRVFTVNPKVLKQTENAVVINNRSLHGSLKWVLVLAQCMGQMPVIGITDTDARSLKFTWKSWRCFYCILNCIGVSFITGFYLYYAIAKGTDLFKSSALAFHLCTLMITLFFLKLATEWPQLMRKWSSVEFSMRSYGWPPHLHTRITVLSIIVLTTATVEYLMTKISDVFKSLRCKNNDDAFLEHHFKSNVYTEIFATVGYGLWKGILLLIENVLTTFAWSFNDLFIMLVSTALALRFKQVTQRLRLIKQNTKTDDFKIWREIREDYNRLSKLTKSLDNALSYLILTSFASNLFFILVQLFHSLREIRDTLEKIYFFFSFGLLILRTLCVSLYGAWIYDESKEPLVILNSVSSEVYNIEIKRFIEQIKFDTVALTGKNFFFVTRGLVLSMAGAVVTYELVLIQFNENLLKESAEKVKNFTGGCY